MTRALKKLIRGPKVIKVLEDAGARKLPRWWLNLVWNAEWRWARTLRRFGIKKPLRPPPWPPRISVAEIVAARDRDRDPESPEGD